MQWCLAINAMTLFVSTPALAAIAPTSPARATVQTKEDLPRFSYGIPKTATDLLISDEASFNAWAAKVANDVNATLAGYDIQDHKTLRDLLEQRLEYEILTNQNSAALATSARIRSLEEKPDEKLVSGLFEDALLKARIEVGRNEGKQFDRAFAARYSAAVSALPWAIVGNRLKEEKASAQVLTRNYALGVIQADVEPVVAQSHSIDARLAGEVLYVREALQLELPQRSAMLAALTREVVDHNVQKPDVWASRDVILTPADKLTPVIVGVWDSGTDLSLFPHQTYTDPHAANANAADAHGLAFDLDGRATSGVLFPLTAEQTAQYPTMLDDMKGFSDLNASVESPESDALKSKLATLTAPEVATYLERLDLFGLYSHGTHVAGIVARGNPAVRLAVARRTFDFRNIPEPPTEEAVHGRAVAYQTTVDWFRAHGVRVVNMSWHFSPDDYEKALELNGMGKDVTERKNLARKFFQIERDAFFNALKSAPGILFVCSAGNSNSDAGFDENAPSSFVLSNLLVVGAADQAGDEASFTSYGKTVVVDANGYQVPSFVPGGRILMRSGTSMASPNVTNLAAKLLALDPKLTPVELKGFIVRGATSSADGRRHNIDPKSSLALLQARH